MNEETNNKTPGEEQGKSSSTAPATKAGSYEGWKAGKIGMPARIAAALGWGKGKAEDSGGGTTNIGVQLAYERTNLAHERTLMAWVRTATTLISFGFTIYKFFELEKANILGMRQQIIGPRLFAILMIAIGVLSLVIATIEHWQHIRSMRRQQVETPLSLAIIVAGFISLFGLMTMIAVIFRL